MQLARPCLVESVRSALPEGIETTDQLALLTTTGCDEAQGYLFGRPAPVDEIVRAGDLRRSR